MISVNPLADLYVLVVDRDGNEGREAVLEHREALLRSSLRDDQALLGALAGQEVEACLLGGHDTPGLPRSDMRSTLHPKEDYFEPFAAQMNVCKDPAEGGKRSQPR